MALGMVVGLGPGHTVLDGDPAPPPDPSSRLDAIEVGRELGALPPFWGG